MRPEDEIVASNALIDLKDLLHTAVESRDARWRERMEKSFNDLAQSTGMVARDSDPFGPLDFVAKILYAHSKADAGEMPVRWWNLDEPLKEKFRQQAINTVASWATEELTQQRMNAKNPLIR